jgi:hypothetical protein
VPGTQKPLPAMVVRIDIQLQETAVEVRNGAIVFGNILRAHRHGYLRRATAA